MKLKGLMILLIDNDRKILELILPNIKSLMTGIIIGCMLSVKSVSDNEDEYRLWNTIIRRQTEYNIDNFENNAGEIKKNAGRKFRWGKRYRKIPPSLENIYI